MELDGHLLGTSIIRNTREKQSDHYRDLVER